ncbi:protein TIC 22-like, chloroplastic [Ziziphus jujuba]|uniref:Protein TIC 22-like, chloroplastic n=1 Tax=Ziziphus jujuba TaxID=326968 RepID=A0A6P4A2H2_ZIZJJ|nr:protein TIC 22-like, chloroplastic [Ziziphus jujuba]
MNFENSNNPKKICSPPKQEQTQLNFQQAFTNLQHHCSGLFDNIFNPNPSTFKTHLQSTFFNLQTQAKHAFEAGISRFELGSSSSSAKNPVWGRIAVDNNKSQFLAEANSRSSGSGTSTEVIEERLAGVPVYALSNAAEEFVLVSGSSTEKSLGLFCFKKEDAETLLEQIRVMDPGMQNGSRVVAVALNKVFDLKVNGVAFRFVPESSQVKNALKERQKAGFPDDGFFGVPVFQSKSLILRSQKKNYRPAFFRKEDLEKSLERASGQQNQLNPAFRLGDIEVAVLEDVIKGMKESSTSKWSDVVFIPPGFDVATDPTSQANSK